MKAYFVFYDDAKLEKYTQGNTEHKQYKVYVELVTKIIIRVNTEPRQWFIVRWRGKNMSGLSGGGDWSPESVCVDRQKGWCIGIETSFNA